MCIHLGHYDHCTSFYPCNLWDLGVQHTPAWMSHSSGVPWLPVATATMVDGPGLTLKSQRIDVSC